MSFRGVFIIKFPDRLYSNAKDYFQAYRKEHSRAMALIDVHLLEAAIELFDNTYTQGSTAFVCGNGGSAAIANHMVGDHSKIIQTDTEIKAKVISLCSNVEMMTAVSNDISYNQVFSYPLNSLGVSGDILLTISGSGNSKNIIEVILAAKKLDMKVISFTGFSGGESAELADINVHVSSKNYGVIEDIHQSLMQIISQFIRMKYMKPELIALRKF